MSQLYHRTGDTINNERVEEFVTLVTNHESRLRAFVVSLVPNWSDAEEVLQQAYLVMWKKFGDFQGGTNFFSWAARIVYLEVQSFRRRSARDKLHFSAEFFDAVASDTEAMEAELEERQRLLNLCITRLKPEQRALLRSRYVDGQSVDSLAAAGGRSGMAIYQMLCRIRRILMECVNRAAVEGRI